MNRIVTPAVVFAALLLSLFVYAIYGAFFAWGLQQPLENILGRDIRYWDLFLVSFLSLAFITPNPIKVE